MIGSRKRLSKNNRSVATDGHVLGKEHSVNSVVPGQPPFTPMLHMKVSSCELASSIKHLGTILLVYDDISLNIRRYTFWAKDRRESMFLSPYGSQLRPDCLDQSRRAMNSFIRISFLVKASQAVSISLYATPHCASFQYSMSFCFRFSRF